MISIGGMNSFAANIEDSSWSFNFRKTNFNLYTPERKKTNKTPVYFYVNGIKGDHLKVAAVKGNYKNSTYTPIRWISRAGKYCLSSNIYEDGYRSARVRGQKVL